MKNGESDADSDYFFLRRFRRSRRFLEPIFLLRLGLAIYFLINASIGCLLIVPKRKHHTPLIPILQAVAVDFT